MNFRPSGPIPGALEPRLRHSAAQPAVATAVSLPPHALDAGFHDRERLEREREGGGAPSERIGVGHKSLFAQVFDFLLR